MGADAAATAKYSAQRRRVVGAGLRVTYTRLAVLHCVETADAALTLTEVRARTYGEAPSVTLASLYRILSDLESAGLVRSHKLINVRGKVTRYTPGYVTRRDDLQFICQSCGARNVVEDDKVTGTLLEAADRNGIKIDRARWMTILYVCPDCNRTES